MAAHNIQHGKVGCPALLAKGPDPLKVTERLLTEALPTLLIGAAGAAVFWFMGFPAAVLTGPASAVSVATLLGFRSYIPLQLRDAVFLVIGISIGSTVVPEVIVSAIALPASFVVLTVTLILVLLIVPKILMRCFAYSRMTAMLAATPGHLSYVLGMSTDLKADVPQVVLVQSIRVLLLTLLVPVLIALWGVEGTARLLDQGLMPARIAILVFALAFTLGWFFKRLRIPAPLLLSAMAVSAIGHGTNITPGALSSWLTTAAFVVMGSLIGTRFRGIGRAEFFGALAAGVVTTIVTCAIATLGAVIAAEIVGLPPAALLLAFAPGGVEVMAALAVETGLEPALVAAHHVFRLILLSVLVPIIVARRGSL
jgi:membrane AbrB-like protein